jgi:phosphohistidine phosphatase
MNLYLVQHGEARSKEEDPSRPLSEKGREEVKKVATTLSEHLTIQVTTILHSGKTRAQQTAQILAEYFDPPEGIQMTEGLEPLAEPSIWSERLAKTDEGLMLVGHLPHLSKLSAYLLCQDEEKKVVNFHRGGIVCLKRDETGLWCIDWMIIPGIL